MVGGTGLGTAREHPQLRASPAALPPSLPRATVAVAHPQLQGVLVIGAGGEVGVDAGPAAEGAGVGWDGLLQLLAVPGIARAGNVAACREEGVRQDMPSWGRGTSVPLGLASPLDIWRPRAGRPSSSSSSSRYDRGTLSWLCSSTLLAGDRGHGLSASTSPCWGYWGQAEGGGAVPYSPVRVPTPPAHLALGQRSHSHPAHLAVHGAGDDCPPLPAQLGPAAAPRALLSAGTAGFILRDLPEGWRVNAEPPTLGKPQQGHTGTVRSQIPPVLMLWGCSLTCRPLVRPGVSGNLP